MSLAAPLPAHVFVELTNHCNMHCGFCPSDDLLKPRRLAAGADVAAFLREVAALGITAPVHFNVLGEPLLDRRIFDHIALCAEIGLRVMLVTNMALLDDARLKRLFAFHNLILVLSLQTPTEASWALRGYRHMAFADYARILERTVRAKYAAASHSRIEVHFATELEEGEALQRPSGAPLWQVWRSRDELDAWLAATARRLQALEAELWAAHPEFHTRERAHSRADFAPAFADGSLTETPDRLLADPRPLHHSGVFGWMFAPGCVISAKQFGLWARQQRFLEKHLAPGEMLFVEEHQGPLYCPMAESLTMLADGTLSQCCLDYEGELGFARHGEAPLAEVLAHPQRLALREDAMRHSLCRRCKGTALVLETTPRAAAEVTAFGAGWAREEGARRNQGGWCYAHAATPVEALLLDLIAPAADWALEVQRQREGADFEALPTLHANPPPGAAHRLELPCALPPAALYRFRPSPGTVLAGLWLRHAPLARPGWAEALASTSVGER